MTSPAPELPITALSPVATAASLFRLAGVLWATVIVKATFQLVHGEIARAIAPESLVPRDRAPGAGLSLVRACETAPHLLNAGVVLSGHACAPAGRAVPSMSVRLGLSRDKPVLDKTLHVFGARAVTDPASVAPFQKMPLVYERAFGGASVRDNPVGTGGPGSTVLPNIVDPKDPRRPAGFGPLSPEWAHRRGLLRGMATPPLDGSIWDVPAGFDWGYFQAAPPDQQIDRLHGDEWIVLDGMNAERPRVQSKLPQVTARATRRIPDGRGATTEEVVELKADTLVIDADSGTASLVWRGRFPVPGLDVVSKARVFVGLELPGRPIPWPATEPRSAAPMTLETQEVNLNAILGASVPFAPDRESHPPPPSAAVRPRAPSTGTAAVDVGAILKGLAPFAPAVETTALPATKRADAPVMGATTTFPATKGPAVGAAPLPFEAADPDRPSRVGLPTPPSQKAPGLATGTTDINLRQLLRDATPFEAPVSALPTPSFEPAPVDRTPDLPSPALPEAAPPAAPLLSLRAPPPVRPPSPPEPPPALSAAVSSSEAPIPARSAALEGADARARVVEALRKKTPLDGEDLTGASLSGLDLSGASLVRCDLRGAKLRGTKLRGADLTRAVLDEADLRGAQLERADLREASLVNANLEQANLTACTAEGAHFDDARLASADLTGARLAGAILRGATLRNARANKVDLSGARLDGADLTSASLKGALARGAIFAEAKLDDADLRGANLESANLHAASRRRTKLGGADLSSARDTPPEG